MDRWIQEVEYTLTLSHEHQSKLHKEHMLTSFKQNLYIEYLKEKYFANTSFGWEGDKKIADIGFSILMKTLYNQHFILMWPVATVCCLDKYIVSLHII